MDEMKRERPKRDPRERNGDESRRRAHQPGASVGDDVEEQPVDPRDRTEVA